MDNAGLGEGEYFFPYFLKGSILYAALPLASLTIALAACAIIVYCFIDEARPPPGEFLLIIAISDLILAINWLVNYICLVND